MTVAVWLLKNTTMVVVIYFAKFKSLEAHTHWTFSVGTTSSFKLLFLDYTMVGVMFKENWIACGFI